MTASLAQACPRIFPIGKIPIRIWDKIPIGIFPIGKIPIGKIPIGILSQILIGIFPIGIPIGRIPIGKIPIGIFSTGIPIRI